MALRKRRSTNARPQRTARRRRGPRRWLVRIGVLLLLMGLLWAAPVIVAHTALKQRILSAALADFEGTVTVGAASLGWLSPLEARDIAAFDAHGVPLANVKSVESEKTLLAMLSNRTRPGTFRVAQPAVLLALRPDGSNWEDALAAYMEAPSEGASVDAVQLEVSGGTIEIRDEATGGRWRVTDLDAAVDLGSDAPGAVRARAAAQVQADGSKAASVTADLVCELGDSQEAAQGQGRLTVRIESLPLAPLAAAARRFGTDVQVLGTLSTDAVCQWRSGGAAKGVQIDRLEAHNLSVRARQWLGDDQLRTAHLNGSGRITTDGERWQLENVSLESDFGRLQANGTIRASQMTWDKLGAALLADAQKQDIQVTGELDIPRLASMLPSTLRLRPTTQIKSGRLRVALATGSATAPGITANVEAAGLAAMAGGREVHWDEPILMTAHLRQTADGTVIDQLVCRSEFLNVAAQGSLAQGHATVDGDLTRLATEAGRLIDLGDLKLAGRLKGDLRWQRSGPQQVDADGKLTLSDFELATATGDPWRESQMTVDVAGAAALAEGRIARVQSATLKLRSADDRLEAELTSPVDQPGAQSAWPVRLRAGGDLASWLPRLQPLASLGGWQVTGTFDVDAVARVAAAGIEAESVAVRLDRFHARGDGWSIDEPRVQLDAKGSWNASERQLVAESMTMTSSTVACGADRVVLRLPKGSPALSGVVSYRADLQRLSQWWRGAGGARTHRLAGSVVGQVRAKHQADVTDVDWSADVQDLAYAARAPSPAGARATPVANTSPWRELWREPTLKLKGRKRYDHGRDRLAVETLSATTDTAKLSVAGTIEGLRGRRMADLGGQIDYDLADLTTKLRGVLGPRIQLTGRQRGTFQINGPLVWPEAAEPSAEVAASSGRRVAGAPASLVPSELTGRATLGWQSANVEGLIVGPGRLDMTLGDAVVRFATLDVPVSQGRFRSAPWIDLTRAPAMLRATKGPLVEDVRISPDMCRTWLKYVAPLLADATSAEGRFSISLDNVEVPIADPQQGDVHGRLTIHSGRIGPGPLAQQFLSVASQVKTAVDAAGGGRAGPAATPWLNLPEQTVAFAISDGKVYHDGMTALVGDVVIQTRGSVGFDQSLAVTAKVPIRDQWVEGKRYLLALKGTAVQIPVHGRLSQPRLDSRALQDLGRNVMRDAAGRLLEDELNRGLRSLFGGRN